MEKQFKLFSIDSFKKDKETNTFTAIISNSSLDREGEVMLASGVDYKTFLKTGGTIFFNHSYDMPVGKTTRIWKTNGNIKAEVKMAERPDNYQGDYFPEYLTSLIEQDIVKGMSVGFIIKDGGTRLPSKKDIKDYGKGVKRIITQWELLEFSIAPLQSNTEALITSHKGLTNKEFNAKIFDIKIEEKKSEKEVVKSVVESEEWDIEIAPQKIKIPQEIEIEIMKRQGRIYL